MTDDASRKRILAHFRSQNERLYGLACELAADAWHLELPRGESQRRLSFCRTIVSQQLSNAAARSIWQRLEPLLQDDPDVRHPERLRAAGLSRPKSLYLQALAGLDFGKLEDFEDDEIRRQLLVYKGVGPWTADMALIFIYGRPDIYSWQDLILRRAAATVFGLDEKKDLEELGRRVDAFRPYRSALALLLWQAADNGRLPRR